MSQSDLNRALFENFHVSPYKAFILIKGKNIEKYKIYEISENIKNICGWEAKEITVDDKWVLKNVYKIDMESILDIFLKANTSAKRYTTICKIKTPEGEYKDVLNNFLITEVKYECENEKKINISGIFIGVSQIYEYKEIFEAVDKNPSVGLAIYQEKYVYANRAAEEILEYSEEELKNMKPEEVVIEELREAIRSIVKKRLKGEQFDRLYQELPVLTKTGKVKNVLVFTRTVLWNGKPAGFVIFVDNTKRKRYEKLLNTFIYISGLVISSKNEKEFLKSLCELLVEKAGFKMVWIGKYTEGEGYVNPLYAYGDDDEYIKSLKITVGESGNYFKGTDHTIKEGKIIVNPDTRTNPQMEPWRKEMLKRGYLSSCSIPINKGEGTYYIINIYTSVPNFFTEEEIAYLEDIRKHVSFAINKIESEKFIRLLSSAVEKGHDWVFITDEEGTILYVNPAVEKISGYKREELIGKNPRIFKSGYHSREFYEEMWKAIKSGDVVETVFVNKKRNGEIFYLEQTIVPVRVEGGLRFVSIAKDITSERFLQEEIVKVKYKDSLTGLPNREGFLTKVREEIEKHREKNHAIIVIDIRNLTAINQIYGTFIGDSVLKEFGKSLKNIFFERDIVGRVGGDEFGIFLEDIESEDITAILEKIFNRTSKPLKVNDKNIPVSINIGIAFYPKDAKDPLALFEKANISANFAKIEGENTYRFFRNEINEYVSKYFNLKESIENALEENRIILYFQPYYYTKTKKLAGFEALMRLYDERKGILTPGDFIHILESTGMIRKVEDKLLRELVEFRKYLKGDISVSFNISPKSFKDHAFISNVKAVAGQIGKHLVLEITERLLVEDPIRAREFLTEVKNLGVRIAIDDFGTGYSSLAYLESLPVDIIKLDISFVRRITESYRSLAIVETIIDLSKRLDIQTVAEGVEKEDTFALLRLLGCDMVQGFFFSKPLTMVEAIALLEASK